MKFALLDISCTTNTVNLRVAIVANADSLTTTVTKRNLLNFSDEFKNPDSSFICATEFNADDSISGKIKTYNLLRIFYLPL